MPTIDELRAANPALKDVDDKTIFDQVSRITGLDAENTAVYLGVPKSRNIAAVANDLAIEFANAAVGGVKSIADFVEPGTDFSKGLGEFIESGERKQSLASQISKEKLGRALESDEIGTQLKGVGSYVTESPLLTAAQALGSFVVPGSAIKGARGVAGAIGATERALASAQRFGPITEEAAMLAKEGARARAGTIGGMATGGAMAGGDAAGEAYDAIMNSPRFADLAEAERQELATRAARKASLMAAPVGFAMGAFGAEAALAKGATTSILKTGAKEFGSEFIEEGATKLSANVAANEYDPDVSIAKGVLGSAAFGGIMGGGTGLTVGALTKQRSGSVLADANDIGTETNTESGAINKAIDSQAPATTINLPQTAQVVTSTEQAQQAASQAAAQQQKDQEVLAQQQAEQEAVNQQRRTVFAKYGGETVAISPTKNVYKFQGKVYFTENQLNQAVDKFVATENEKSPTQLAVEEAYLQANALTGGKALNPNSLAKAVSQYVEQAESIEEVLARVQLDLDNALKSVKSEQQLAKIEPIHALRDELAGIPPDQRVATIDLLPKGQLDGKLQLQKQGDARVRTVSKQGGTTEGDGRGPGVLQPSSVQPVQPGSVAQGPISQQVGQPAAGGVRVGTDVSTTGGPSVQGGQDALQGKGQGQVNEQGQIQTTDQEGRGPISGQDAEGSRTAAEEAQDRAESVVSEVINSIIEAIVKRTGRMSAKNLASLKEFMYYDFFQVASKEKDGLSVKELADMYKVSSDTIDGWRKIAGKFFDENRGAIQAKILEGIAARGITLEQLKLDLQAVRNAKQNDVVVLEEAEALITGKGEKLSKDEAEIEEVAKGELEGFKLDADESTLDQRDLGSETGGMSVSTGRVQRSIQEQDKPEETINARIERKLEEYNKAVEAGDEVKEAALMAEIDDLTKEAKKVDTKRVAKSTAIAEAKAPKKKPTERKKRAVQKPSTKEVPVREGTGSSEKVGKRDTEKREVAAEGKTDEEIWDSLGVPVKYAELTEQAKADWMLSVKEGKTNLAAANKVFEDNEGAITVQGKTRASFAFAKQDVMTSSSTKEKLSVATTTFDKLAIAFPGLQQVKAKYEALGISNALNAVEQWMVTDSPVVWDAIITLQDGKVTVVVSKEAFSDNVIAAVAGSHEIGHAVDYTITHSGVYSDNQTFNLFIGKDGQVKGMGEIAKEIINLYNSDSNWKMLMGYPLDRKAHKDLDANAVREELFAQLWSYMTNDTGRAYIEQTAPITFAYMQGVINDVKKQTYGQAARQSLGRPDFTKASREVEADTRAEGGVQKVSRGARESRQARNINKLPKPLQSSVSEITATISDLARRGLTYWSFTEDLAKMASKYIKSATEYVRLVREQQAIKTKYERRVDLILQQYDKLDAKLRGTGPGSVNAFLKKSTMDGKWAYDPGYLKKAPDIDAALAAEFNALPKSAQDVIKAVFKHGHDTLQDMKRGVIDNINSEYDALIKAARDANDMLEVASLEQKKAASLKDYNTLMAVRAGKPYAPLKRFGNFVVVAKSNAYLQAEADIKDKTKTAEERKEARAKLRELEKNETDYYVAFAETKREGRKIEEQLLTEGYGYVSEAFEKDSAKQDVYGGRDVQNVFYRLRNLANDSMDEAGGAKATQAINRLIADLHLTLLAEQSARQSERRRKNVAGAEDDMMRSFATQGLATAHFISSLHNSGKIYDTLQKMREEADVQKPGRDVRRQYYNEFMRRHALGLSYEPNTIMNKALGTTSFWMLLTNPAYYLQNMTQPFMMSLPYVAGKHDYDKAWSEFTTAYKQIFTMIKTEGLSEESYAKLPADVRDAIETLVNNGRIDISLDQDLGRWRDNEGTKAELAGKAIEKLRKVAQDIESINRVATAVAAYRLEIKDGSNKEQAVAYADDVILRTHGDYSGFNAPRITRQGLGRLATQFRKFQLIQISLMAKLVKDSFAGASVDEKRVARRALAFTLSHTLAMGGVMGLPGFAAIAWILGAAFGDDDEPDNPELTLRKMIGDKALADIILKGAPKFAGVDLSGKLGMGQMLSILPYTDVDLSRAGIAQTGYALLTGATGGLIQRAGEGVGLIGQGDYYKGMEKLMPSGIAQTVKAARMGLMDGVTLKNGDVVIKPEDINFLDMLSVAIGLPSNKITDRTFVQGAAIDTEQFYKTRTGEIKRDYIKASIARDSDAMAKARQEWQEMQTAKRNNGLKIQPLSDLLKAPQEQKKREAGVVGGVQTTKSNREFMKQISKL